MITRSQLKHDAWETKSFPKVVQLPDGLPEVCWDLGDSEVFAECQFESFTHALRFVREAERLTAQAIARAL